MRKFKVYWVPGAGEPEVMKGTSIEDALRRAGYSLKVLQTVVELWDDITDGDSMERVK